MIKKSKKQELIRELPYELLHFLINTKCLTKFINDVLIYGWDHIPFSQKIEDLKTNDPFVNIFEIDKTPEGYDYWITIAKKYEIYYKENLQLLTINKLIKMK